MLIESGVYLFEVGDLFVNMIVNEMSDTLHCAANYLLLSESRNLFDFLNFVYSSQIGCVNCILNCCATGDALYTDADFVSAAEPHWTNSP